MKLYYTQTSPYSRKVRLVIREKGLEKGIEEIVVDPFRDEPELQAINPLGKVPTLQLDDGTTLFDSPVICEYLDGLTEGRLLLPATGQDRWLALRWQALADGMTDVAYSLVMERRRPAEAQSPPWIDQWSREIQRALGKCEHWVAELDGPPGLAQLAVGAAVGYLDFRVPELLYEAECPQVAAFPRLYSWYGTFATRPSMVTTRPDVLP
ncbi:MAG: hypothetical protein OI74_07890 [Gammaproteobacteria bacterium (ex Lamellibrachia satsuma)]|nr:MAG: glutathione S-transferase [Gammaproteobacteria bacterium (ex Lamellibrachia satsuma)]RRS33390.1 MAG: hypothetical protein OI74_07890 [Gammaproteobacteria bacterium (ex Lamellibrachia satsuma)]RRS35043.1 MAG: hypothetical protein NV67_11520 [Gammaproteobacteria bacterium (ex Lamellibrachia satsuma)]